uniref:SFRICE_037255 n=1 Tax=Spodoptera frugiperda TaxID=7108 RepID=A0A2H1WVV6_SPOFR
MTSKCDSAQRPAISMDHGWKHFKFYMLYAWGCPIVLTACMAIVNFYPGKHQKPGIGLNHCWFFSTLNYKLRALRTVLL